MTTGVTLLYDADCAFCQRCVVLGRRWLGRFPDAVGFQHADLDSFGVTRAQAERSIQLCRPGRSAVHGAAAIAAILLAQRGFGWQVLGTAMTVAPLSWMAAAAYAAVSRYRHRLPGGTAACRPG